MNFISKITIFIMLVSSQLYAAEDTNDLWYGFFNKKTLNSSYAWWTEAQLRYDLDDSTTQQTLFRTGLLKELRAKTEIGFLYAFIQSESNKEHRFALQHVQKYAELMRMNMSHRIRLEVRTIENSTNLPERFRYLLRLQQDTESKWNFVVWDEVFINLSQDEASQIETIERNRLFLGYRFSKLKDLKLELGYLNQYVPRKNKNLMEHILALYIFM